MTGLLHWRRVTCRTQIKRQMSCNSTEHAESNFLSWIPRWELARPDPLGYDLEGPMSLPQNPTSEYLHHFKQPQYSISYELTYG